MTKDEIIAVQEGIILKNEKEIEWLKLELDNLKKLIFGSKKERYKSQIVSPGQLSLFGDEPPCEHTEQVTETISYNRKKPSSHKGRNELPSHLPVVEVILEPLEDTTDMVKIGEDITKTLDYTPASLVIVLTRRFKYAKKDHVDDDARATIVIAPMPNRPIAKCIAEAALLSYIITRKFIDHMPFYRQIQGFKREFNWNPSKSTVNDWFINVCTLLQPLYEHLQKTLLEAKYIQADESPIKVQDEQKKGKTHLGYQWVYHSYTNGIILFQYHPSRGYQAVKELLQDYQGYVQCDGYAVYDKLGAENRHIQLVGCWVHARRKFFEALQYDKKMATHALDLIAGMYEHEAICKTFTAEQRKAYRDEHTRPIIDQLYEWIHENSIKVLPKSPIGKAMIYAIEQKPKLLACLNDGQLELDNNLIENKIRPLALGRKNYLFAGSHTAGQRIAMMYSFFATCAAHNVNPQLWLKYVLENINECKLSEIDKLMPYNVHL